MAASSRPATATVHELNPLVGGTAGILFVVVGLVGFSVSWGHPAVGQHGGALLGLFEVNALHNVVHLGVGASLVAGALAGRVAARAVNTMVGGGYVVLGILGLFVLDSGADILALNGFDNGLHLGVGLFLLAIGLLADR